MKIFVTWRLLLTGSRVLFITPHYLMEQLKLRPIVKVVQAVNLFFSVFYLSKSVDVVDGFGVDLRIFV